MQGLKVEQGFNNWGLEMTWTNDLVTLKNISDYQHVPGIRKAFDANAKFILAILCELHETDGTLSKEANVIDAYYGSDEPSLADDVWNSIKRWVTISLK